MEEKEKENEQPDYEILPDDYPKYDLSFKIIIIGNSGVGKSCLSVKATKNVFENNYLATVGFEFFNFNIKLGERVIRLQIWDTCGQEIYQSLVSNFYRNSSLAFMVYAINDKKSFEHINNWLKEIKYNSNPDIKIFLIGNKCDLIDDRQVTYEEAKNLYENYEFSKFYEVSAKTGENAENIIIEAAKVLAADYNDYINDKKKKKNSDENIDLKSEGSKKGGNKNNESKKKCC